MKGRRQFSVAILIGFFMSSTLLPTRAHADPFFIGGVVTILGCTLLEKMVTRPSQKCGENVKKLFGGVLGSDEKPGSPAAGTSSSAVASNAKVVEFSGRCRLDKGVIGSAAGSGCEVLTDSNGQFKKYNAQNLSLLEFARNNIQPKPAWTQIQCPSGSSLQVGITGETRTRSSFEDVSGRMTLQCLGGGKPPRVVGKVYDVLFERSSTFGFKIKGWIEGEKDASGNTRLRHFSVNSLGGEIEEVRQVRFQNGRMTIDHIGGYSCFVTAWTNKVLKSKAQCDENARIVMERDEEIWCEPSALGMVKKDSVRSLREGVLQQCRNEKGGPYTQMAFRRLTRPNNQEQLVESDRKPIIVLASEVLDTKGEVLDNSLVMPVPDSFRKDPGTK